MATTFIPLESRCLFFCIYIRLSAAELCHGQALYEYIYIYMLVDGVKVGSDGPLSIGPIAFLDFQSDDWSRKWRRFAVILAFGFLGIARPGEPLAAFRKDLILPRDMLSEDDGIAYLRILKPKTRFTGGGGTQHLSVHDHEFVPLLDSVF